RRPLRRDVRREPLRQIRREDSVRDVQIQLEPHLRAVLHHRLGGMQQRRAAGERRRRACDPKTAPHSQSRHRASCWLANSTRFWGRREETRKRRFFLTAEGAEDAEGQRGFPCVLRVLSGEERACQTATPTG